MQGDELQEASKKATDEMLSVTGVESESLKENAAASSNAKRGFRSTALEQLEMLAKSKRVQHETETESKSNNIGIDIKVMSDTFGRHRNCCLDLTSGTQ